MEALQQTIAKLDEIVPTDRTTIGPAAPGSAREDAETPVAEQGQQADAPAVRSNKSEREIVGSTTESGPAAPEPASLKKKRRRGPSAKAQSFIAFLDERHGGVVSEGSTNLSLVTEHKAWLAENPTDQRDDQWKAKHPRHQNWEPVSESFVRAFLKRHPDREHTARRRTSP